MICGDDWSIKETMVACRDLKLGYGQQPVQVCIYIFEDDPSGYNGISVPLACRKR